MRKVLIIGLLILLLSGLLGAAAAGSYNDVKFPSARIGSLGGPNFSGGGFSSGK